MNRRQILFFAFGSIASSMLVSCASEEFVGNVAGTGRAISFEVGVAGSVDVATTKSGADDFLPTSSIALHGGDSTLYANCDERNTIDMHYKTAPQTRGNIQSTADFYSSFGLFGYVYEKSSSWASNNKSISPDSKINNVEVSKSGDKWVTNSYWPGSTKNATFFAYAPYNCSGATFSTTGTPTVTYTIPQTISEQQDLLIAKSSENILCDGQTIPSLSFNHALSAIVFKQGTLPSGYSIKSIEISGVYDKGMLSFEGTEWNNLQGTASYTTTSLSDVLFLMPQTIPSGAKLSVTFNTGTEDKVLSSDLNGVEWEKGCKYTYSISANEITGTYKFEVTPSSKYVEIGGGTVNFIVKSFYEYSDGETVSVAWSCSNATTQNGSVGKDGNSFVLSVSSNSDNVINHNSTLQSRTSKGNSTTPWNLSNNTGASAIENTANCYVVGSKGTYSIPLVYGNAIKNGKINAIAYNENSPTGTFVNHLGNQIKNPYIYENYTGGGSSGSKIAASSVALVWQDVIGLIEKSSLKLSADKHFIIFSIGDKIAQGNALIAVKDADGKIMWSWHIWVTDRDEDMYNTETITTLDGNHENDFMNYPVGWCDKNPTGVLSRSYTLDFTQNGSGQTISQIIIQDGTTAKDGNALFYEWGRKDPMGANNNDYNALKTKYDIDGNIFTMTSSSQATKSDAIQNPNIFYTRGSGTGEYNWETYSTYDNWNATGGTSNHMGNYTETIKTIYDPSPIGFKLWPAYALSVFTSTGTNSLYGAIINSNGSYTDNGWYLYTNSGKTRTTFWKLLGHMNSYSTMGCTRCDYWSAQTATGASSYNFYITSSIVSPQETDARANGFSVRPVKE